MVDKDLARNRLIVAQGSDHPRLYKSALTVSALHWIAGEAPALPLRCRAKTRYRQPDQDCVVSATATGFRFDFDVPQRAVTPGQSAVIYLGDVCLGGGVIERALD